MGLFSGSIPPWFVLSNNLSTTNTRAIWLCSGAFLSPPAPPLSALLTAGHYPLVPRPTPHALRSTLHAPRSSGSAVDTARRAGYSTPLQAEGQHAAKCYVFRFLAEVWRA